MSEQSDGYEVMITVEAPAVIKSGVGVVELILDGRVIFNGHTATVNEFLQACMPYLDEIAGTLDGIRSMRMIEGHEFARLEYERKQP